MSNENSDYDQEPEPHDGDFDENDTKIVSLYEIINELIEEGKSRVNDLNLLQSDNVDDGTNLMDQIEERNDLVLQQLFQELDLKERKEEEEDEDDEDETDQGWEIYNAVVKNLNDYMETMAEFIQKMKNVKQKLNSNDGDNGPSQNEIDELEKVIEEQTLALEQQMLRNEQLEGALTNVLSEYSKRISSSNDEIANLHSQLSQQNSLHQQQLRELRNMYEAKIHELQSNNEDGYKDEIRKLLDTLASSRGDFKQQIDALTADMSANQRIHHKKIIKLMQEKDKISKEFTNLQTEHKALRRERESALDIVIDSLDCIRSDLEIDDEEEFYYYQKNYQNKSNSNNLQNYNKNNINTNNTNTNDIANRYGMRNNRDNNNYKSYNNSNRDNNNTKSKQHVKFDTNIESKDNRSDYHNPNNNDNQHSSKSKSSKNSNNRTNQSNQSNQSNIHATNTNHNIHNSSYNSRRKDNNNTVSGVTGLSKKSKKNIKSSTFK